MSREINRRDHSVNRASPAREGSCGSGPPRFPTVCRARIACGLTRPPAIRRPSRRRMNRKGRTCLASQWIVSSVDVSGFELRTIATDGVWI